MKKIKINEIFTTDDVLTATNLIFNQLVLKEDLNDFINSNNVDTLNQDYYLSHSGDKYISPFVERLFNAGKTASEIANMLRDKELVVEEKIQHLNKKLNELTNENT